VYIDVGACVRQSLEIALLVTTFIRGVGVGIAKQKLAVCSVDLMGFMMTSSLSGEGSSRRLPRDRF
jgi:hypothetical protein